MTAQMTRRKALLGAAGTALSVALAACGGNQETAAQTATPSASGSGSGGTLGLGIVGLFVADLGVSLDFYRRLGLDIPIDVDLSGGDFRLRMPNGQILFWETFAYTRRDFPDYEPATGDRKVALEFGFQTPRDVDEMHAALVADGSDSYFPPTTWGSIRYAVVVDPDDNQIALRFPLAS